jgi:hypothetical protein
MLSDENVAEINRQMNLALKDLANSHTPYFRNKALTRIRELKEIMDELGVDTEKDEETVDEVVISLDEVVDTLRDLFRRRKNRTK